MAWLHGIGEKTGGSTLFCEHVFGQSLAKAHFLPGTARPQALAFMIKSRWVLTFLTSSSGFRFLSCEVGPSAPQPPRSGFCSVLSHPFCSSEVLAFGEIPLLPF